MQEIHKELNDLAVSAGRAIQSEETGFIHSFHGKKELPHKAISVQDNLLFVLALCRIKTVESVQEGKSLLEKLLAYQSKEGYFPTYLHEFPFYFDRHNGGKLLPPLFEIYRHFHRVLGSELSQKLATALKNLLDASLREVDQMSLPNRFRVGGALAGVGKAMFMPEWVKKGNELLDVQALMQHPSRFIPKHLGEALSGSLMAEGSASSVLLQWMRSLWHPYLCSYAGPFMQIYFDQGMSEITLYDFYMLSEKIPSRIKKSQKCLNAALLFPHLETEMEVMRPIDAIISPTCSFSWVKTDSLAGHYPFSFLWGTSDCPKHLILSTEHAVSFNGKGLLEVIMGAPKLESKDPGRELFWYFSDGPGMQILVNGMTSSTFRAGDVITIEDSMMKIELIFSSSDGIFQGHFSKCSSPSETQNFGTNRFAAYEWQLLWRAISRPDPCVISIQFSYVPKN